MEVKKHIDSHLGSKKFTAAIFGTLSVLFVFAVSLIAMIFCPPIASNVAGLANICIVFLGSVTGALITGQSFVDWRNQGENRFNSETKNSVEESTRTENYNEKREIIERIERPKKYDDGGEY